ncbi:hypothetical protein K501DRAFT_172823 [Backusella circina FSU 941]|nr:hypothetical protein K501DRAFT_172823 [Backusella circina FSU 941]
MFLTGQVICNIIVPLHKRTQDLSGKFIHLTDLHFDPDYLEGASVKSHCHRKDGDLRKGTAGHFGALGSKCDSPKALIDATFEFLKGKIPEADFVIYTGDSARHDRDKELPRTKEQVINIQKMLVKQFSESFGRVFPVIGNNDVFDNNNVKLNDPQFKEFADIWSPFRLNFKTDFEAGGFYEQDIIPNKLRVIGANTMAFIKKNKLLDEDCNVQGSFGQIHLAWLQYKLEQARRDRTNVYILAHVPPNSKKDKHFFKDTCYTYYYGLLGTYSDVIIGHFSGHFNYDQLTAVLQENGKDVYTRVAALGEEEVPMTAEELKLYSVKNVLYNTPSIVPQQNPAVRVYKYETEGTKYPVGTILDWEQYYANLDEANASGKLAYSLEYTASQLYNVDRFDASGIQAVFKAISLRDEVREKYTEYRLVMAGSEKSQ